jgi:leucyl/phenylalanyl-tRNA--protein transferase
MDVPMSPELGGGHTLGWWSPDPRGVLELDELRVSRSLVKSYRRFDITFDQRFEDVMRACADPNRPQGWITDEFIDAYVHLNHRGFAHSIEVWSGAELVGGLYGVEIGGLFAGESMFHHARDASKAALVALVERLRGCSGQRLIDVQWSTPHLASLGVREIARSDYLERLPMLVAQPPCLG